jgi:hydroxymethylbilane synthase
MDTEGDRKPDIPLPDIGGKGLFTAELEAAILDGEIDIAVHSLKDLPTDLPSGLALLGVPEREDPADVLVSKPGLRLSELEDGARVGTSSLRRRALLLNARPDCRPLDVRGNVETRSSRRPA